MRAGDPCLISAGKDVSSSTPLTWPLTNIIPQPNITRPSTDLMDGQCTLIAAGTTLSLSLDISDRRVSQWVRSVTLVVANGTPISHGRVSVTSRGEVRV